MEPTQTPPAPTPVTTPEKPSGGGALVALVIVIAIIVVGAYYFWSERMHDRAAEEAALRDLDAQSASTEPSAIESDLDAESPDEFEAELDAALSDLDAEFEAE